MTQESFEKDAKTELERLKKSNAELEEMIKPMLDEINCNNKKIEHLEGYLLVSGTQSEEIGGIVKTKIMRNIRSRKDYQPPFRVVARKILEKYGKPLHYRQLMQLLVEEENYLVGGKNPRANMTAHLSSNKDFVRMEEIGFWGLREWQERKAASLNPNNFLNDDEKDREWSVFLASIKEDNNHLISSILKKARVIKFTLDEVQFEFLDEGPFKLIDKEKLKKLLHKYFGVIPRIKLELKPDQNGS